MMPARSAARQRLADLMEARRLELGLRWREVAEADGLSYEAVRAVRNGNRLIRPLTMRGLEIGLRWAPGSVKAILDGGDPVPLSAASENPPAEPEPERGETTSLGAQVIELALADPVAAVRREVRQQRRAGVPEEKIFKDPHEARIWHYMPGDDEAKIEYIAFLRLKVGAARNRGNETVGYLRLKRHARYRGRRRPGSAARGGPARTVQ